MIKHSDKLLNMRAVKLRISPTRTFDRGEDPFGEPDLFVAELSVSFADIVNFLGLGLLREIEKALDAAWSQRRSPSTAIDPCKTPSRFCDFLFELSGTSNQRKLVLNI